MVLLLVFASAGTCLHAQEDDSLLFNEVASSLDTAHDQSANILCPLRYAEAVEHYNNSKYYKADGKPAQDIIIELEKSKSIIAGISNEIAERTNTFSQVLAARESTRESGAEKYSIEYWMTAEDDLKDAVEDYSDKDYKDVQEALPVIIQNYNTAKEYADYENYLLTQWEPLKNANNQLANLLSGENYRKGKSKFNEALAGISGCRDMNSIKQLVSDAGSLFDKASDDSKKFISSYPEVIHERKDAAAEEAEIYSAKLWNDGEEALSEAAHLYNQNEINDAVESTIKAKQKYIEAKHLALKTKILSKANELVHIAYEDDAEEYAQKSFHEAKEMIKNIKKIINGDKYDYSNLKFLADRAETEANLTIKITDTIKSVEDGAKTWEELILDWNIFSYIENIPPENSVIETPPPVNNIITEPAPIPEKPAVPEKTSVKSAPRINRIPGEVYREFSTDEAVFIDDGNEIIIKLAGAEFSKRSSVINNKTKQLINKVICAFDSFLYTKVEVTVYSIDMSSEISNQKLSQRRADRIRNYIVSRDNTSQSRISTAGYREDRSNDNYNPAKEFTRNCLVEIILK